MDQLDQEYRTMQILIKQTMQILKWEVWTGNSQNKLSKELKSYKNSASLR